MTKASEIFFIASPGGCATKSLASLFNQVAPEIKCFHGNELPLAPELGRTSQGELNILERQLNYSIANNKITGSVHSVYTSSARKWCLDHGGKSAVLFRNPVKRAMSILRMEDKPNLIRNIDTKEGGDALSILIEVYKLNDYFSGDEKIDGERFNFIILFLASIKYDRLNMKGFPKQEWFKFEDYTKNTGKLQSLFETVLPEHLRSSLGNLDMAKSQRYHYRSEKVSDDDIYSILNKDINFLGSLIQIVEILLMKINFNIRYIYDILEYDIFNSTSPEPAC